MQIQSSDGRITIQIISNGQKDVILPQADFSLIETPSDIERCRALFTNLHKTQRNNHICLTFVRLPKRMRLRGFANLSAAEEAGFKYHDHITIFSQEEQKNIPSNLTQVGETCVLFTKSEELNKAATAWFREDLGDCSNVWDVTAQENEKANYKTVSRHFSTELGAIMSGLASPLVCRKFLVIGPAEIAMAEFASFADMSLHVITEDEISAKRVIKAYEKLLTKNEGKKKNG